VKKLAGSGLAAVEKSRNWAINGLGGVENMKKVAFVVLLGIVSILLADCVVYPRVGPPALRAEVMIGSPGPGYVWIAGYWGWSGGSYHWHRGHWVRARHGRSWVDGRWEQRGNKWNWRKGHWR
jgi:hypothetical protein